MVDATVVLIPEIGGKDGLYGRNPRGRKAWYDRKGCLMLRKGSDIMAADRYKGNGRAILH